MRDKIMRPIVLIFSLALLVFSVFVPSFEKVHAMYGSSVVGSSSFQIANWNVNVSLDGSSNLNIDLKDTLIENNFSMAKVVPGTKGAMNINLNLAGTEVSVVYELKSVIGSELPSNIKFYSDSAMQNEINLEEGINGVSELANNNQPVVITLYWQWVFTDDNENEWMDRDIVLYLNLFAAQKVN